MLVSGGLPGDDTRGESNGPLHRDDSTFGEYMAALDSRSSSGNGVRRLNSSGTAFKQSSTDMLSGSCHIPTGRRQAISFIYKDNKHDGNNHKRITSTI